MYFSCTSVIFLVQACLTLVCSGYYTDGLGGDPGSTKQGDLSPLLLLSVDTEG